VKCRKLSDFFIKTAVVRQKQQTIVAKIILVLQVNSKFLLNEFKPDIFNLIYYLDNPTSACLGFFFQFVYS